MILPTVSDLPLNFDRMDSKQEKEFMDYWEANREKEKKVSNQLLVGIPVGMLFALPVLLLVFSGRFWYKRADMVANSQLNPGILIAAILLIIGFVAIFYKKHQWEMKEQQYQEFKSREQNSG